MIFDISQCHCVIVFGAGHGIGHAMVQILLEKYKAETIYAVYRIDSKAKELKDLAKKYSSRLKLIQIDSTSDQDVHELAQSFTQKGLSFDLIINAIGILHDEQISPEKSLKSFHSDSFLKIIRVNTLPTILIAKYFEPLIDRCAPNAFIILSAKVGSIEDNKMGGWYSYRASKACLNMLIKNISIEFSRKKNNCLVLAIHPGTTKTQLSEPFIEKTNYILHSATETATNIFNVVSNTELSHTGKFYSWDGQELPW